MRIRGTKPTREERKLLAEHNIDTHKYLVRKHTSTFIEIIHIETGEIIKIDI